MALAVVGGAAAPAPPAAPKPASVHLAKVLTAEFLYESAPFPSCHASTIVETENHQLVAAFFGGTAERNPDVCIYVCRRVDGKWTAPLEVASGIQTQVTPATATTKAATPTRYPTWNPVLFQPKGQPLTLYYKVGPSPAEWWGMSMTSTDDGKTWSTPKRLPDGFLGPIKDKPIQLPNGNVLAGSSDESHGWSVHFELYTDSGTTWKKILLPSNQSFDAIQPTILVHPADASAPDKSIPKLQALCRTKEKVIAETWSSDAGITWSPLAPTSLPNPNSGIDATTLADGRFLLAYNPTPQDRTPLTLAVSQDGKSW
ncbi:MAG TPA: sialidase family protein, partial [Phycisphaerae bacterium]